MPRARTLTAEESSRIGIALAAHLRGLGRPVPRWLLAHPSPSDVLAGFHDLEFNDVIPRTLFTTMKARVRSDIWRNEAPDPRWGAWNTPKQELRNARLRATRAQRKSDEADAAAVGAAQRVAASKVKSDRAALTLAAKIATIKAKIDASHRAEADAEVAKWEALLLDT